MEHRTEDVHASEVAFVSLYAAHYSRVLAYAARRCTNSANAPDVAAEVFVAAWRHHAEALDEPLPWLLRTCANAVRNSNRSERRKALLHRAVASEPQRQEDATGVTARDARTLQALRRLKNRDQEILRLLYWDDLTPIEACAVLGISDGAFRVRLHRAHKRLAALLPSLTTPSQPVGMAPLRTDVCPHD